jgi:hypothetical protein
VWAAALASTVPARKIPAAAKPKPKPLIVTSNSPGRLRGRPGSRTAQRPAYLVNLLEVIRDAGL